MAAPKEERTRFRETAPTRIALERLLKRGGQADVWLGRHVHLGRPVAVKILPVAMQTPEAVERFENEALVTAELGDHPNMVQVLDAGEGWDGCRYIAYEYCAGGSLADMQRDAPGKRLTIERGVDLILEACSAVQECHAAGVVHRDIKPGNLLLAIDRNGGERIKLADLGIARILPSARRTDHDRTVRRTAMGMMLGSLAYAAPEQAGDARNADVRADVFGLAATLHRLVTGHRPKAGKTEAELAAARAVPLRQHLPGAPRALEAVLLRAMASRPGARYPSVAHLAAALRPFGSRATKDATGKASARRRHHGSLAVAVATVVTLATLILVPAAAGRRLHRKAALELDAPLSRAVSTLRFESPTPPSVPEPVAQAEPAPQMPAPPPKPRPAPPPARAPSAPPRPPTPRPTVSAEAPAPERLRPDVPFNPWE